LLDSRDNNFELPLLNFHDGVKTIEGNPLFL